MILFRACPKCHGDVHWEKDVYGRYYLCLQCGYLVDVEALRKQERVASPEEGITALAA